MNCEKIYEAELLSREKISGDNGTQNIQQLNLKKPDGFPKITAGSSIAVYPHNNETLVNKLLDLTGFNEETEVTLNNTQLTLREALTSHLELGRLTRKTLQNYLKFIDIDYLREMQDDPEQISMLLEGKNIADFLNETPIHNMSVEMLIQLLEPIKPRYFFISKNEPVSDEIQIVVSEKRFKYGGLDKKGICSAYLLDEANISDAITIAPSTKKQFSLPEDHTTDIIMIGAESGVSPFRSFLHHRMVSQAGGKNWLMFSAQNKDTDFIYQGEIEDAFEKGSIHKLDTVYKTDQEQSIFVQHKVREHKEEIIKWINEGAHLYICADSEHKVTIVHNALVRAIAELENYKFEEAEDYLFDLEGKGQYQRITF